MDFMSISLETPKKELKLIYAELPEVKCQACGTCCVSPTVTLLEFVYLMDDLCRSGGEDLLASFLNKPTEFHARHDGNLVCRLLGPEGKCLAHSHRTMACRLHGLPVINELGIRNLENCEKVEPRLQPQIPVDRLRAWLGRLTTLSENIQEKYEEPYWLTGLNLECWLAVVYDPLMDMGPFRRAKEILQSRFPMLREFGFKNETRLREKVDKISMLFEFFSVGVSEDVLEILDSIMNDYPQTGTYYLKEAEDYKKVLEKRFKKG